jgi:hypothetical protein
MTNLHEAGDPTFAAQIDKIGWVFAAVVVVITAVAGILAYQGRDAMVAQNPVSQVATAR